MQTANNNVQDGLTHMIEKVNKLDPKKVAEFEGKIVDGLADADDLAKICEKCLFDVKFMNGSLAEFKSYSLETVRKITTGQGASFQKQFKQYLQTINSFDDLVYYFNKTKIDDIDLIKKEFQSLLGSNADEIYKLKPELFNNSKMKIPNSKVLKTLADNDKLLEHPILDFIKLE